MNTLNYTEYNKIIKEVLVLSKIKNAAYGCSNLMLWEGKGIIVRMNDKISRLNNIIFNDSLEEDELIEDTLKDLINYAVYFIMLKRHKLTEVIK